MLGGGSVPCVGHNRQSRRALPGCKVSQQAGVIKGDERISYRLCGLEATSRCHSLQCRPAVQMPWPEPSMPSTIHEAHMEVQLGPLHLLVAQPAQDRKDGGDIKAMEQKSEQLNGLLVAQACCGAANRASHQDISPPSCCSFLCTSTLKYSLYAKWTYSKALNKT